MGTCDRCGPMVPALVETDLGLSFCGHCYLLNAAALVLAGGRVTNDMRTPENSFQPV